MVATAFPTKLFIGGISKETSTKILRDHFAKYAHVLDCVAMKDANGQSRGFGLVTLDSPAAAMRCLGEPMVIDGRVVDMKMAQPAVKAYNTGRAFTAPAKKEPCKEALLIKQAATVKTPVKAAAPPARLSEDDMLVYAEDYVCFLEDQQDQILVKAKACVPSDAKPAAAALPATTEKSAETDSTDAEDDAMVCELTAGELPSLGSALHASGECRLCNFHRRGTCSAGKDCQFCHLPHDKIKVKRMGKRERQAAVQRKAVEEIESDESDDVPAPTLRTLEQNKKDNSPCISFEAPPGLSRSIFSDVFSVLSSGQGYSSDPLVNSYGISFPNPGFALNLSDYGDSDSDSEASVANAIVNSRVDVVTSSTEVPSSNSDDKLDCCISRMQMLRVMASMKAGVAAANEPTVAHGMPRVSARC